MTTIWEQPVDQMQLNHLLALAEHWHNSYDACQKSSEKKKFAVQRFYEDSNSKEIASSMKVENILKLQTAYNKQLIGTTLFPARNSLHS